MKKFARRCLFVFLLLTVAGTTFLRQAVADADSRPNILIILTDDQGYGDLGCQPHLMARVSTPNIDRLASQGVRFTQAYANGHVCAPSRAALLTGRYPQTFGFQGNGDAGVGIPTPERLLPAYFKEAGYATACMGKWHLGWDAVNHPHHRGFDEFFGFLGGQHDYFDPNVGHVGVGMDSNGQAPVLEGMEPVDQIKYLTEEITDRAIDFLRRTGETPAFCLYVAYNAVHGPLQAPTNYLARHNGGASARDTLLAMLASLDDNVGRLLTALEDLKLADDTFVFYMGDNGGTPTADNWKLRSSKGHFFEGGIRVPAIARWPGRLKAGQVYRSPILGMDVLPTVLAAAQMNPGRKLDGVNLLPYVTGKKTHRPHEFMHWQLSRWFAVRRGDWKYVVDRDGEGLFNLEVDEEESIDLRDQQPKIVKELLSIHQAWSDALPTQLAKRK